MTQLLAPLDHAHDHAHSEAREVLGFVIEGSAYGVDIPTIAEILRLLEVTPVPRAPSFILGVLSVRGRLVTIVSTRELLRIPPAASLTRQRVLLINVGKETLGFVVDEVLQVFRVLREEVEPPEVLTDDPAPHALGIARTGSETLILLDLARLLDDRW